MVLEVVLLETNHRGGEFIVRLLACVHSLDGCGGHDDPAWPEHLQLQVSVVRHVHELGITRPPKYGVVGS